MTKTRRRVTTITAIILGVVAIAVAILVWWILSRPPEARDAAERYVAALETGDFGAIEPLLDPSTPADQVSVWRQAFEAATAYVEAAELGDPHEGAAGSVTFPATALLADERVAIPFELALNGGRWILASESLATVEVSTSLGTAVTIGDAVVALGSTTLLPARYDVRAYPDDLATGTVEVVAAPGRLLDVSVDATLSPEATETAQTTLEEHLTACTTTATTIPSGCGLTIPWGVELASLTGLEYRIERMPTVQLDAEEGTFTATGGDYRVVASGLTRNGDATSITYRDDGWGLRGSIALVGDTLTLSPW